MISAQFFVGVISMKKIGLIVCLLFAVLTAFAKGASDNGSAALGGNTGTVSAKPVEFTVFLNFNNMVFNQIGRAHV